VAQHNPTDHASTILKLDTEKFKIAKQASDLEIEGERLQSELSRLGNVLGELEAEGVEGGERERGPEEDATVYVYYRTSPNYPIPVSNSTSIPVSRSLYGCIDAWMNKANPTIHSLKLKVYRTLGIDVEADSTTGQYNKAVIRNAEKGDVHVVTIDPKFSRNFYTNYFWRTM
jgi:kinetochore protein Spc24